MTLVGLFLALCLLLAALRLLLLFLFALFLLALVRLLGHLKRAQKIAHQPTERFLIARLGRKLL